MKSFHAYSSTGAAETIRTAAAPSARGARIGLSMLLLGCLCCDVEKAVAQAVKPEDRAATTQPRNEQVRSTEGPIYRAATIEGRELRSNDRKDVGKIQDLILDLDTGRVAFLVLSGEEGAKVAVPFNAVSDLGSEDEKMRVSSEQIYKAPRVPKSASDLSRSWAAAALKHFEMAPYWNTEKFQVHDHDQLVPVKSLRGIVVLDKDGKELGRIQDCAVTSHGDIAYVGLALAGNEQKLHPVPLSGFVVPEGNTEWRLNLPRDIVANTPAFDANNWPKTLDRGWLEYVHVRYGRSVFDGVNRSTRPNQAQADKGEAR